MSRISTKLVFFATAFFALGTGPARACEAPPVLASSPNGQLVASFCLDRGQPTYALSFRGESVLAPSKLALHLRGLPALASGFRLIDVERESRDSVWEQVWGEERYIRDAHHEMRVRLAQGERRMTIVFRVFDDGLGFRYEIPAQDALTNFEIECEQSEFRFAEDGEAWWIPAFTNDTYEILYRKNRLSELAGAVHTPVTIEMKNYVVSLHEAAVVDYPTIGLAAGNGTTLVSALTPWADGSGAKVHTPLRTPWRTIQVARTAGDLITSYLNLNLNEPNKLTDTSWIRPMKYMGIWWALHTGRGSWSSQYPDLGATTENAIRHLDAAKRFGIAGLLIEGWNTGWDGSPFSYTQSNPRFDLREVARHAREIGVELIGHHETNGAITNYEQQLEAAFSLYSEVGVRSVKTGYVGKRVEGGEFHYGQWMVRHHQHVVERAAAHRIMLDVHEPVKDTGLRRTYPNLMTREGMRGMEFDAWSDANGNPPAHTAILPFTRGLSGPMDYTPGIFDLLIGERRGENRIRTTLAKQLALYVVLYSPLQMAADLPEFYEGHPAFQFIRDVPVDWHTTRVLNAKIGDYLTTVRRDRNSSDWYLGSLTNEAPRELTVRLDFLDAGKTYCAQIYRDAADADWKTKPLRFEIATSVVSHRDSFQIRLAPGGGQAVRFYEVIDPVACR